MTTNVGAGPRSAGRRGARLVVAVALLIGAAGCGGDDGDGGTGSPAGADADSAATAKERPCSPVGVELEATATKTVPVLLQNFAFSPSEVRVDAGVVSFMATNAGTENHELAFLPGGGEVPERADGEPDEDALAEAGAFELEAFAPGMSCNATYDLKPGTYTLFCIVTSADGRTHYDKGMRGTLVVG